MGKKKSFLDKHRNKIAYAVFIIYLLWYVDVVPDALPIIGATDDLIVWAISHFLIAKKK